MNPLLVRLRIGKNYCVEEVTKEEVDADKKEEVVTVTTSEETANTEEQKEEEPDYQRVGFATHTPCGDGVISQVLDDGRAVVILLASFYSISLNDLIEKRKQMLLVLQLVFLLLMLYQNLLMRKYYNSIILIYRNLLLFLFYVVKFTVMFVFVNLIDL